MRRKFSLALITVPSSSNSITACARLMASTLPSYSAVCSLDAVTLVANFTTLTGLPSLSKNRVVGGSEPDLFAALCQPLELRSVVLTPAELAPEFCVLQVIPRSRGRRRSGGAFRRSRRGRIRTSGGNSHSR